MLTKIHEASKHIFPPCASVQSCNYLELHFKRYLIKILCSGQRLNEIGFLETREHPNLLPLYLSNKAYVAQPLLEL